jgi:hypothetical protein
MAYTINLTDGTIFATIPDGTINTSSSMILVGKNYAGYGEFLDENFVHLLENSSNTTAPGAPLTGQLWWDSANSLLKVYNGITFKTISAATASSTAPTGNVTGDLWYDTSSSLLKVWTGSAWLTVGPSVVSGTGAQAITISDLANNQHDVVLITAANSNVAIFSTDSVFQPSPSITGFGNIFPGLTMSNLGNLSTGNTITGTASNAKLFDGQAVSTFMRSNGTTSTTGTLSVLNNTGLSVGNNSDFNVGVSGTNVTLRNITSNGNLVIQVNQGGVPSNAIVINGTTGIVTIPNLAGNVALSNISVGNINNLNANGVGNIGNSSSYFNRLFATSTSALYADVAERFAADVVMEPGTVVELGGSAEITCSLTELSETVFGVISTRAAYLMNSGAGTDATHPPVAMTGRVPVRTIGTVRKGDRLVSAGAGLARAAQSGEATAFNVIGRALTDKNTADEGTVEAIVTIK